MNSIWRKLFGYVLKWSQLTAAHPFTNKAHHQSVLTVMPYTEFEYFFRRYWGFIGPQISAYHRWISRNSKLSPSNSEFTVTLTWDDWELVQFLNLLTNEIFCLLHQEQNLSKSQTGYYPQTNKQTNKKLASPKFEYVIESKYLQLPCLWYIDFEIGNKFYDYLQSHLNLKLSFSLGLERKLQWEPKTHSYQQHEY